MSNPNAAFGFMPFQASPGPVANFSINSTRKVLSTYATKIHRGTPVVSLSSGYINVATPGTTQIAGIFWGVEYFSTVRKQWVWSPYWPAGTPTTTDARVQIIDDPNLLFICQSTGASASIVFADIGANAQFTVGTGNDTTGQSASTLNDAGITTTSTLPFRIIGLASSYLPPGTDGTDDTSVYNRVIVRANFTDRTSTTGI